MNNLRSHRNTAPIPSVNFHLWEPCNMRCGFCFATFLDVKRDMNLPKGHLRKEDCITLVDRIGAFGFEKINFAGGEPTLCPWLHALIARAKAHGMVTSIVTNGSRITKHWLDDLNGTLDWIGLSIDSVSPERLKRLGRVSGKETIITADMYLKIIEAIKMRGIRLKINTVVTSVNSDEDFTPFIKLAAPER